MLLNNFLFQVIIRGARYFGAVETIWPQNSKLRLLRSVAEANRGSVATALRAMLPTMKRFVSMSKSMRSARLAELNGSAAGRTPAEKAHAHVTLRVVSRTYLWGAVSQRD